MTERSECSKGFIVFSSSPGDEIAWLRAVPAVLRMNRIVAQVGCASILYSDINLKARKSSILVNHKLRAWTIDKTGTISYVGMKYFIQQIERLYEYKSK